MVAPAPEMPPVALKEILLFGHCLPLIAAMMGAVEIVLTVIITQLV